MALTRNCAVDRHLLGQGLTATDVGSDGNCFFRAVSVCVYGNESRHALLRHEVAQHIAGHSQTIFADFCNEVASPSYYKMLAADVFADGVWPGENVIKATADYFRRNLHVFTAASNTPLLYSPSTSSDLPSIFLAFYEPGHYKAVVSSSSSSAPLGELSSSADAHVTPVVPIWDTRAAVTNTSASLDKQGNELGR